LGKGVSLDYNDYFEKNVISETCFSFRWDLNKVPKGCDQIILLAQLISHYRSLNKNIKLRPDKRKRAKGLLVVFVNEQEPIQQSTSKSQLDLENA